MSQQKANSNTVEVPIWSEILPPYVIGELLKIKKLELKKKRHQTN